MGTVPALDRDDCAEDDLGVIRLLISAGIRLLATIIVWLAALIAGLILPLILVKRVASDRRASAWGVVTSG